MKELQISKDLALPLDAQTSTMIVYGGKGMGKTVFGAVFAEELHRCSLRWSWLDPLGVGWGIRHAADGNGPGVECLILGGIHGDIPIDPKGGAAVADVVVEESVNVLIDFSRKPSGEMWGVGERIRFATDYARRLFQRQGDIVGGKRREPLMQFLDEGARYIPQTVPAGNPDLSHCVAAWQQFVEEGRNVGLGLCVLTQRSARINKDVAELADAMLAFRTVGPNSLGAVMDWLGTHVDKARAKELSAQVRELPRGSALIVSPGWLKTEGVIPIRMRSTFDSSATPKPGEKQRTARGDGAKPDLEKIRERMAETIERAKADDPKALRARIAELEKAAKVGQRDAKPEKVVERVEVPAFDEAAWRSLCTGLDGELTSVERDVAARLVKARHAMDDLVGRYRKAVSMAKPATKTVTAPGRPGHVPYNGQRPAAPRPTNGGSKPNAERKILIALAQHDGSASKRKVALLCGYASKGGYFNNTLGAMRTRGLVAGSDTLELTDAGRAELGAWEPLPIGDAALEHWASELGGAPGNILRALRDAGGELGKGELADAIGAAVGGGYFNNMLGKLRTLELISGSATLGLSEELR